MSPKITKTEIDKDRFAEHPYHDKILLDFDIPTHFLYLVERQVFRYFDPLVEFLSHNTHLTVYLTTQKSVSNFQYFGNDVLVNIDNFIDFCDNIGHSKKDPNRIKAFFGQHISIENIQLTEDEKQKFIEASITDQNLHNSLQNLSEEAQEKLLTTILALAEGDGTQSESSAENLVNILSRFLNEGKIQNSVLENLPHIQLNALKELKDFVVQNLNQNETFFQNWIDEEKGKYRRKRCLIFGIDYVDPKREGEIMGRKRFDILATQNREHHILIELKSPTAEIFEIEETENQNGGKRTTYKLSKELSRAIPQILSYKRWYSELNDEKVQELGLLSKKHVSECIIIIGTRKEDDVWKANFQSLCESLKIKILTYTDLIDKMDNAIKNLSENL